MVSLAGNLAEDTMKSVGCNFKSCLKEFCGDISFFGKDQSHARLNRFYFDMGLGAFNNPLTKQLQKVFVKNGYLGLGPSDGMIGNLHPTAGTPSAFGKSDVQYRFGFGYCISRFLRVGLDFRDIPATFADGYVSKSPYDYADADKQEELVKGNFTKFNITVQLINYHSDNRKLVDISMTGALIDYNFTYLTAMNINQYDTTTQLQIIGQAQIKNTYQAWGESLGLNADIYLTKHFSLQLTEEFLFNVKTEVPEVSFSSYPYERKIDAHTLNFQTSIFSAALAFHFW